MLGKGVFLKSLARQTSCVQFQRLVLARLSPSAPKSDAAKDWNREKDLFQFTRGRFVYDGSENLTRRRIQFNMNNLADIAARTIGATRCDKIEKCPDGLYNKAYILTMDNGKEVIGKVPNPNAGLPHYTTASEVATMDFMRNVLQTPVPQVYAWNSRVDQNNAVGAEYIVMEKLPGIPIGKIWDSLQPRDRVKICMQILAHQKRWTATKFFRSGSLYYSGDVEDRTPGGHLYVDGDGNSVDSTRYTVGPAVGREWVDEGRQQLQCDRGPWHTVFGNRTAVALRERAAIESFPDIPKQLVMIYGPGVYQPVSAKKLAALDAYSALLKLLLPDNSALKTGHIWHNDLHHENVFVDPEKPNEALGIIDWQSTQIMPLFDHCLDPNFLGYEGPDVGDNLEPPELPDEVDNLNGEEKTTALREFYAQSIMVAWRMVVKAKNPAQYNAIQFRNSKAGHLLHLAQNIAVLGEAHFRALLLDLRDEWAESPLAPEFPLQFSEGEVAEIEADVKAADLGIQIMNTIKQRLGDQWPEKGLIEHENFEVVMAELREIKAELMDRFAKSQEEREGFQECWPFDC